MDFQGGNTMNNLREIAFIKVENDKITDFVFTSPYICRMKSFSFLL